MTPPSRQDDGNVRAPTLACTGCVFAGVVVHMVVRDGGGFVVSRCLSSRLFALFHVFGGLKMFQSTTVGLACQRTSFDLGCFFVLFDVLGLFWVVLGRFGCFVLTLAP